MRGHLCPDSCQGLGAAGAGAPSPGAGGPTVGGSRDRQVEQPGLSLERPVPAGVWQGWGWTFLLQSWPRSPYRREAWLKLLPRSLLLPQKLVLESSRDRHLVKDGA